MSLTTRELINTFYGSDLIHNDEIMNDYLHSDVDLRWYSSSGFFKMKFDDIIGFFKELRSSFEFSRCEISDMLIDKEKVSISCFIVFNISR